MIPLSITSDLGLLHHQLGNKMTEIQQLNVQKHSPAHNDKATGDRHLAPLIPSFYTLVTSYVSSTLET